MLSQLHMQKLQKCLVLQRSRSEKCPAQARGGQLSACVGPLPAVQSGGINEACHRATERGRAMLQEEAETNCSSARVCTIGCGIFSCKPAVKVKGDCLPFSASPALHTQRWSHRCTGRPNTAVPRCMSKVARLPRGAMRNDGAEEEVKTQLMAAGGAASLCCLCICASAASSAVTAG